MKVIVREIIIKLLGCIKILKLSLPAKIFF